MKPPPCYCDQAPRDRATGQPRFRCNVCVNAILDEKNRLVRGEQEFVARVAVAHENGKAAGAHEEGERLLGIIASWRAAPDDYQAATVVAVLDLLASCIPHRGMTREAALDAVRKRLADLPVANAGGRTRG